MMNTLIGIPSCEQVASSWMFICTEPSPATQTTVWSGHPTLAPIAAGQAEPHRPEPTGVDPAPRAREVVVLSSPHLMLPDVAGDDRVAAGRLVERLDHVLRLDLRVSAVLIDQWVTLPPGVDPLPPVLEPGRVGRQRAVLGGQPRQDVLGVADDRDVRRHVLGDLGRIDVDVDELGVRGELGQLRR